MLPGPMCDVICQSMCSECQRQAKQVKLKAPLHPLPIVVGVLKDSWMEGNVVDSSLIEWVEKLKTIVAVFAVLACDETALSKTG